MRSLTPFLPGDGLLWPLSGSGVGPGPLPTNGKAAAVPEPAVAADVLQAGNTLSDLPPELPLDDIILVEQ